MAWTAAGGFWTVIFITLMAVCIVDMLNDWWRR